MHVHPRFMRRTPLVSPAQQAVDRLCTFNAKIGDARFGAMLAFRRQDGPQSDEDVTAVVGFDRDAVGDAG